MGRRTSSNKRAASESSGSESDPEYIVEAILDKRTKKGQVEYLIKVSFLPVLHLHCTLTDSWTE